MLLISLPLLVRTSVVIKKFAIIISKYLVYVCNYSQLEASQLFAYFHKGIILTKRKSHALSFLGSLTSISHCSIWNMAIGNEDARVLKAHLQFEWQPAQHTAVYTFMLIPAQNRWEQNLITGTVKGHLHFQLHLCVQDLTMFLISIGSSSLQFHVLSGSYARCQELQKERAISNQLGNFLLALLSVRPPSGIFQSVYNTVCFKIAPSCIKDL